MEHDKGFRDLLSNASVFVSLLMVFIKESWTVQVKPEQLELVHTSFITPAFEKREVDLIYKLKRTKPALKTGPLTVDVYFYCLLELQSSVDFSMPVRLLVYMVSFWIELLKNTPESERTRKDFRLPVIIPLVLYNGLEPWTAEMKAYPDRKVHAKSFPPRRLDPQKYSGNPDNRFLKFYHPRPGN